MENNQIYARLGKIFEDVFDDNSIPITPELSAKEVDGWDSITHIRGVVICRSGDVGVWDIDAWLMSSRALGRKVEHAVFRELLKHAREHGVRTVTGTYKPTNRYKLVVDDSAKLGFTKTYSDQTGLTRRELQVSASEPESAPMTVVSSDFSEFVQGSNA
jgi:hypothetical protein